MNRIQTELLLRKAQSGDTGALDTLITAYYALPHKQCALQRGHGFFLFLLGCFCVYIHCGGNIRMTHDFLNDLQVGFVLAEASAECVPQDMAAKLWQKNRVTIFFLRLGFFFLIIVCTNRADSAIDGIGEINLSIASAENKAGVPINFIGAETNDLLILVFFQKGIEHFMNSVTMFSKSSAEAWSSIVPS